MQKSFVAITSHGLLLLLALDMFASSTRADVYVSMIFGDSVYRYSEGATGSPTASGQIGFNFTPHQYGGPSGVTVGPDGNVYVSDAFSGQILRFNGSTGAYMNVFAETNVDPTGVVPPNYGYAAPGPLRFGPDGALYVATSNPGTSVQRFTFNAASGTGTFSNYVGAGLTNGAGVVFDPAGNMTFTDLGNFTFGTGKVMQLTAAQLASVNAGGTQTATTLAGYPLFAPAGMLYLPADATHPAPRLLVADLAANRIYTFSTAGAVQGVFAVLPPTDSNYPNNAIWGDPASMILDRNGNVLVAALGQDQNHSNQSGSVLRYDTNGNYLGAFAASSVYPNPSDQDHYLPAPSDLVLISPQANWQGGSGSFGDSNWNRTPQSGDTVIFGNATALVTPAPVLAGSTTVTIDNAYTVGSILFTNASGAQYSLAADNVSGHGLTLNNGGAGAAVNVTSVSAAISAPLILADTGGTTFYVGSGLSLTLSGSVTASGSGNTLTKTAGGTLEFQTVPALNNNSSIYVNSGTLRFNVPSGSATLAQGATVTVSSDASLELAGSDSALGIAGGNRTAIVNNSIAAAGLHVTAGIQTVGGIDGTGSTVVDSGAQLTADHIIQTSLVIGSGSTFTLAPSDASGNPLDAVVSGTANPLTNGGLMLAGSLAPASGFAGPTDFGALFNTEFFPGGGPTMFASIGASVNTVPEPSALSLAFIAMAGAFGYRFARERRTL